MPRSRPAQAQKTGGDAGFAPGVTVYDPAGNGVLDTATVSGLERQLTLGASGTYVVQVHDWTGTTNTGTYQLGVEWLTPVAKRCASVTTLGCGPTQTRTLAGVGRHDLHTFVAEAGDRIWLMSRQTSGDGFVPRLRVYDPTGTVIAEGGTGDQQLYGLTTTGTYTVDVHDWNGVSHTGTYELGLEWLAPAAKQCGGQALACGTPLTPTWPGGMRHDHFSFAGTAGDRIWLTLARTAGDPGFTPGVTVYDPNGNGVLSTATAAGIDPQLDLAVTGTYVVQVYDWSGTTNTGTYALAANWLMPSGKRCGVSPAGCDNTVAAAVGSAAQIRLHAFPAKAGDSLRLSFAKTGGASAFAPIIRVYDPSGGLVAGLGSDGVLALDNLPEQGFYLANVHDANLLSAGSYSLRRTAVASGDCWAVPEFTSLDRARFRTATPGLFAITAVGNPVPTLAQSGVLPDVVTFAATLGGSATLSGTAGAAGVYPLALTAANSWGTTPQAFTLAVNDPLAFTDDPLQARSTVAKAVHVTEMRTAIDSLRAFYALPPFAWTDHPVSPGVTAVKVQQVLELRQAVDEVYLALARATPIYADAVLTAGTTAIKAVHVAEIRAAINAIW